jgi:hypothetical protein
MNEDAEAEFARLKMKAKLIERMVEILRRHISLEDTQLDDAQFIENIYKRHKKALELPLIDPNE